MDTNHKLILFKDLSYQLQGAFYEARNKYGQFHKEIIYHNALKEIFDSKSIKYVSEPRIGIMSLMTDKKLGVYVPDFLIDNLIIIELKASPFTVKNMEMQTIEYLKSSQYELAYLVNFGEDKFRPKRYIHTKDKKSLNNNVIS